MNNRKLQINIKKIYINFLSLVTQGKIINNMLHRIFISLIIVCLLLRFFFIIYQLLFWSTPSSAYTSWNWYNLYCTGQPHRTLNNIKSEKYCLILIDYFMTILDSFSLYKTMPNQIVQHLPYMTQHSSWSCINYLRSFFLFQSVI